MIVEELPVVKNTIVTQLSPKKYVYPFLSTFHSYVPENVIENFDIENRIDYSNSSFDVSGILKDEYGFNLGSKVDSESFTNSVRYFDIIKKHATEFGVDPYIILAMMAQESGGKNINSNGIMQITGSSPRTISATNVNGQQIVFTLYPENKQNPDDSIKFATMYFKNLLDIYKNPYKALQAYNFGSGTMQKVKDANPEAWESQYGWLYYREAGRQAQKPGSKSASYGCINYPQPIPQSGSYFGDSCYVENVLRYYAGDNLNAISNANNSTNDSSSSWSVLKNFGNFVSNMIVKRDDEALGKVKEFKFSFNPDTINDIFRMTEAFNQAEMFSEVEIEDLSFFDSGFYSSSATIGIGYEQFINLLPNANGYVKPLVSIPYISSPFGYRKHPIYGDWRLHTGIDIPQSEGTPIYAIADGIVEKATFNKYSGNFISISHGDGILSRYAHMLNYVVKQGDLVKQGQLIGFVGSTGDSTGSHLHFEIKKDNTFIDPTPLVIK